MQKSEKLNHYYSALFLLVPSLLFLTFSVIPSILNIILAFTDWSGFKMNEFSFIGLDNFRQMLQEPAFFKAIKNSFYFAIVNVIGGNTLAILLALLLSSNIKWKTFYRTSYFIPTTLSLLVVAPIFNALYNPYSGPINVFLRSIGLDFLTHDWLLSPSLAMNSILLMTWWSSLGMAVLIYIAGIQSISKDYYEAAEIDGCNSWKKTIYITLPLLVQAATVNIALSLIGGLSVFGQVYALTNGGPNDSTQVFATFMFKNFSQGLYGYAAALSLAFSIIVCIFAFSVIGFMRKLEVEL